MKHRGGEAPEAGLLALREIDEALSLTELAGQALADTNPLGEE